MDRRELAMTATLLEPAVAIGRSAAESASGIPQQRPAVPAAPAGVEALTAFVASVQHLPLFSGMAAQLIRSVDRDDANVAELTRLISTDAALVAHLLRIVNSAYYGLDRRVGTVTEACTMLGLDLVRRTLTIAVLGRPLFAFLHDTRVARAFWHNELLCASLARHLAVRHGTDPEQTYLAGLLHDVGRLVMLMKFPQHSDALLRLRTAGESRDIDDGSSQFGVAHAQVGAALLENWGLPEAIVQSAHQHADETEPEDPTAAIVWRAVRFARDFGDEDDANERPWMEAIGLDGDGRRRMLGEIALFCAGG